MGGGAAPMGGCMQAQPQQIPTPAQEFQFYQQIFNVLDTEKKKALNGGQVFNFFLSSGLTKAVLADVCFDHLSIQTILLFLMG